MKQLLSKSLLRLVGILTLILPNFIPKATLSQTSIAGKPELTSTLTASASVTCQKVSLPVSLTPNDSAQYYVRGRMCSQYPLEGRTLQVLVPGGTYNSIYWDFPFQPEEYSYVSAITQAGYATLNLDRIGTGASDHPPPDQVNVASNAQVLHQVIQALHTGKVGNVNFNRVLLVGHSFGSIVSVAEASQYADVDGLILTGFLHNLNPNALNEFSNDFYPAQLDPHFSQENLLPDYLTTRPNTRQLLFYYEPNAEAQVIALDEATKDTQTYDELITAESDVSSDISKQINVPVLVVVGQYDNIVCSGIICDSAANLTEAEAPYYSVSASLMTFVLPQAGHNINLHQNAREWYKVAIQWSNRFVGNTQCRQPVSQHSSLQQFFRSTDHSTLRLGC